MNDIEIITKEPLMNDRETIIKKESMKPGESDLSTYEKRATIGYSTIGKQGTLKIVSIMNFLQDAASEHADLMGISGFDLAKENLGWVISRYHIEIKNHPYWKDKVLIRTHRFPFKNLYEIRMLNIIKDVPENLVKTDNEIVNARGCWIMVNKKNGRPVRLSRFMDKKIFQDNEVVNGKSTIVDSARSDSVHENSSVQGNSNQNSEGLESYFSDVIRPQEIHYQLPFKVRMHDLDLNGHVNNAIFVEWGVETVPEKILSRFFPATIDVIFNKESLYGDIIISNTEIRELSGNLLTLHSIIRQQDQTELAMLNICWHALIDISQSSGEKNNVQRLLVPRQR